MVNRLHTSNNFQGRGRGARKLPQTPKTPSTLPNHMKPQFGAIDPPQDKAKYESFDRIVITISSKYFYYIHSVL